MILNSSLEFAVSKGLSTPYLVWSKINGIKFLTYFHVPASLAQAQIDLLDLRCLGLLRLCNDAKIVNCGGIIGS